MTKGPGNRYSSTLGFGIQFLRVVEPYGHVARKLIQFHDSLVSSKVPASHRLAALVNQFVLAGPIEFMTSESDLRSRRDPVTGDSKRSQGLQPVQTQGWWD